MGEERGRGATRAKTPAPSTASRASITRRHGLVALAIYAAVSMVLFGLPILRNFSRAYIGLGLDPPLFMWFLVWWPHALRHWLDPFVTSAVWAPTGVDLAWTTSIPGPSLVAAPLTAVFGPIVAFNVLTLLAPALAAWTAYVLCRHVTRSFWPSLIGGYLFGFSTYELGHQISHLDLTLVFAVPLAVYLVLLGIDGVLGPLAFVGFLAATLVLQFSISTEVFATATVFGATVMLLALAVAPAGARRRVRSTGGLMLCAYALAALVLIPYLRHVVAGGYPRLQTPIVDPEQYSTDLLNFFMPTPITLIGGHVFDAVTKYFKTNYQEAVAYMSAPLLAIVYLFGRVRWRTAEGQLLLVPFLLACVASLGPTIHVDGVPIVSLWRPLLRLPLLNNALPDRVMMYGFLTAAVIVAVWLGSPDTPRLTKWVLVPLSMLLLLPNIPAGYWQTPVTTPDFFARGLYRGYLASGENTIVIPYGTRGDSMLWQAQAEMYFRMAGGYISPTMPEEFLQWPIFSSLYTGTSVPSYREQLFAFLAAHDVRAILVDDAYTTAPATRAEWPELLGSLGLPSVHVGGIVLYRVPPPVPPEQTALEMQQRLALDEAAALLTAAQRYVDAGGPRAALIPSQVESLGLLPADWAPTMPRLGPWTFNGLWLGPWGTSEIGVGIVGSGVQLDPVIRRYAAFAADVYFPYPQRLAGDARARSGELLLVFTPDGLARVTDAR